MTAFDSWYATHIEANLPSDMPPQVRKVAKEQAAKIWNAALDACQEMMLRCCCGHPRSEHVNDREHCSHPKCSCVQLCDCWVIVSEMTEEKQPDFLQQQFLPLKA